MTTWAIKGKRVCNTAFLLLPLFITLHPHPAFAPRPPLRHIGLYCTAAAPFSLQKFLYERGRCHDHHFSSSIDWESSHKAWHLASNAHFIQTQWRIFFSRPEILRFLSHVNIVADNESFFNANLYIYVQTAYHKSRKYLIVNFTRTSYPSLSLLLNFVRFLFSHKSNFFLTQKNGSQRIKQ